MVSFSYFGPKIICNSRWLEMDCLTIQIISNYAQNVNLKKNQLTLKLKT